MILDSLTESLAETGMKVKSKKDVLEKMLDVACRSGKVKNKALAKKDLQERENLSSTGMQNGIAIPHAKTDAVDELIACIGISEKPVPFESLDGKPAQIFLMTLSPKGQGGPHIRFLADVAKLLKNDEARYALLQAGSAKEVLQAIAKYENS